MPEASIWPDEVALEFVDPTNLLELAVDGGVPIAHLCGGRARCSTCRVRVVEGMASLSERTPGEAAMAAKLDFPDEVRLACQTEITGRCGCGGWSSIRSTWTWLPSSAADTTWDRLDVRSTRPL